MDGLEPDPEVGVLDAPAHRHHRSRVADATQEEEHVAHDVPARVGEQGRGVACDRRTELRQQVEEAEAHVPVLGAGQDVEQETDGGGAHARDEGGDGAEFLVREVGEGGDQRLDRVAVRRLPGGGPERRRCGPLPRAPAHDPLEEGGRRPDPPRGEPAEVAGLEAPQDGRQGIGGDVVALGEREQPLGRVALEVRVPEDEADLRRRRAEDAIGAVLRQVEEGGERRGRRLRVAEGVDVVGREGQAGGELPRNHPRRGRSRDLAARPRRGPSERPVQHGCRLRGEDRRKLIHQP